jgi:hypothetical protein
MKVRTHCAAVASLAVAMLLPVSAAHAQLGNLLKGGSDSSSGSSSLGGLGSMLSGQSATSGSTGNVAGVLQFCVKNNYLSGGNASAASSVKDSLMSKLGGSATSDSGYSEGSSGILDSGNGKKVDLSGGGLKEQVTKQICDKILSQGKSLL